MSTTKIAIVSVQKGSIYKKVATAAFGNFRDDTPKPIGLVSGGVVLGTPPKRGSVEIFELNWEEDHATRVFKPGEIVTVVFDGYQIAGSALPKSNGRYSVSGSWARLP